jgi:2-C-methyl-D-erythritol 4-phosphate cytidylyltransferase / 2-C-methyl-D-erythritol 2,4-cyclodiphosphate synthase
LSGERPTGAEAIVAAAGASRRAGTDKLAALVGGRPLLRWTLEALAGSAAVGRLVVVTSAERLPLLRDAPWLPSLVASVVAGGGRRHESVAAGVGELARLGAPDDAVVLVHDAARPAVPAALIAAVAEAVGRHGAAIPVVPVAETLKRLDGDLVAETVPREGLAAAQTPQGARLGLLRAAFERFPPGGPETWTDEAALLEACSIPVHAIPGHPDNLKVTLPADLDRAAAVLAPPVPRIGFGHDGHPFGPGEPLALGGVEIAGAPRLRGHSDGDAALHAVADALLGAAAMGDLGRLFPADGRTPRGIGSTMLLETVVARLGSVGLRPSSVDLVIVAGRPRLAAHLEAMRERLADLLGLPVERVSVKASTGNLDGSEGAGRSISARAVAVVEPTR